MVVKKKGPRFQKWAYLGHVGEIWAVNKPRNETEDKKRKKKKRSEIPDTSPLDIDHQINSGVHKDKNRDHVHLHLQTKKQDW